MCRSILCLLAVLSLTALSAQSGSACGNNVCDPGETYISCPEDCSLPIVMGAWGADMHHAQAGSPEWNEFVATWRDLHQIGFTHAGVNLSYSGGGDAEIIPLRNIGLRLMFKSSPAHYEILSGNDNGAQYFNTPNFNPLQCASGCQCAGQPDVGAYDPAYDGALWQQELDRVSYIHDRLSVMDEDVVFFDSEIWRGGRSTERCYPGILQNSLPPRYSGSAEERYAQYRGHQLQRAADINNRINAINPNVLKLYYFENIPRWTEAWLDYTYWPQGSGSVPSPVLYYVGALTNCPPSVTGGRTTCKTFTQLTSDFGPNAYANSIPWVSFNYSIPHAEARSRGNTALSEYASWDPNVSQKAGYLLRRAGAAGFFEWPGVPRWDSDVCLPRLDYMRHAQAFHRGFYEQVDPGELLEYCDDGVDNNGDAVVDEALCTQSVCGNGVREGDEECDGLDLLQAQCGWFGSETGAVSCRSDCRYDTTQCTPSLPQSPMDLTVSNPSSTGLQLHWTDVSTSEDGFIVERKQGSNGVFAELSPRLPANSAEYSDTGLTPDTDYDYRVRAFRQTVRSSYSNRARGRTISAEAGPPDTGLSRFYSCSDPINTDEQRRQPRICMELATAGPVLMEVFDIRGKKVRTILDEEKAGGAHVIVWDGKNDDGNPAVSGLYNVVMTFKKNDSVLKTKVVIIR